MEHNGATRWLKIGIEFQPSEIVKFALILCFASMITIWGPKRMRTFRYGILPFVAIIGVIALLLVKQPHLSATVIIGVTGIVMIFLGGANLAWLISMGVAGVAGCVGLIFLLPHAMARVKVWWMDLERFPGRRLAGGPIADGHWLGRLLGPGPGQGRQKHLFLPATGQRLHLFSGL